MPSKNSPNQVKTTTPMDVGPDQSLGLAAAYDGIYHLFNGRVAKWTVTPDGLVAEGFTVDATYDPERILNDVNRRVRRAQLWPTLRWIMGEAPEPFVRPEDITTFMVQFFKGAEEEGSSKAPKYIRTAAAIYKERTGTKIARGPKPKSLPLTNLSEVNESILLRAGVTHEDIIHLMEIAQKALDATPSVTVETPTTAVEATA